MSNDGAANLAVKALQLERRGASTHPSMLLLYIAQLKSSAAEQACCKDREEKGGMHAWDVIMHADHAAKPYRVVLDASPISLPATACTRATPVLTSGVRPICAAPV